MDVGPEIQESSEIMKEIVEKQPFLYNSAIAGAHEDRRVLTAALASSEEFAKDFFLSLHLQGKDDEIGEIRKFLDEYAAALKTFSEHLEQHAFHSVRQRHRNILDWL